MFSENKYTCASKHLLFSFSTCWQNKYKNFQDAEIQRPTPCMEGGHNAVLLQELKMKGSSSKQCKVSISQKGHFILARVEPNLLILRQ